VGGRVSSRPYPHSLIQYSIRNLQAHANPCNADCLTRNEQVSGFESARWLFSTRWIACAGSAYRYDANRFRTPVDPPRLLCYQTAAGSRFPRLGTEGCLCRSECLESSSW
jgi:hypothetical protein